MEPVPAATVLLVRDGAAGVEVLMLERRPDSGFVPGAQVFPGGALDPGDHDPVTHQWCDGPDDALAHRVAAVREAFEEAGVLLARDAADRPIDPQVVAELQPERDRLDDGDTDLATLAGRHGLTLSTASLRPFAHWVTPMGAPRRYDTAFFVAPAPADQPATPCRREVVAACWITPAEALQRFGDGAFPLILPTERCLRAISVAPTAADLLASLDAELARTDGPRHVADRGGRRLAVAADLAPAPDMGPTPDMQGTPA